MEGQNRKNTKNEKSSGNNLKTDVNKADKEKIKELARKRQELEEEIDELKGNTAKGKTVCIVVFLLMIGLSFGLFVSMVKLDAGGFASEVLAPAIADIPVLRSILPAQMQKKSASELAAEQAQAQAEAERMQAQAEAEAAQAQAQAAQAQAAQAEEKAALQDYVDTYSAMKPQNAAKLFESMIPNKEDVVISILENLTPEERAAILSNMSITNAADLTDKMRK